MYKTKIPQFKFAYITIPIEWGEDDISAILYTNFIAKNIHFFFLNKQYKINYVNTKICEIKYLFYLTYNNPFKGIRPF